MTSFSVENCNLVEVHVMEDGQRKAYDRLLNERDKEAEIARAEEKFIREIVVIIKMQSSKTSFCYYLSLTDEWVKVTKHGSLPVSLVDGKSRMKAVNTHILFLLTH